MLSEQILTYVRENLNAGFKRSDIEAQLLAAGWDSVDIAAAISTVTGESASPLRRATGAGSSAPSVEQQSIDAEVARIQAELKKSPNTKKKNFETPEVGIIGFMLRHNLASSKQMANSVLIILAVCAVALALWLIIS